MRLNNKRYFEPRIKESLEAFRQGYIARDINAADQFIDRLFDKSDKTAVLGTSFGEWMVGPEGAKEIVESDWKYWGDVDFDTKAADITVFNDIALINLKGTVKYIFEYTPEKFDSYLGFVKHFFDPADDDYRMSAKAKAGQIGFVLTHFNQIRKEGKREYYYPLRINAIMKMQEDRAVFRFMKFSMETYSQYPELRVDNEMMDMAGYYEQQKGFAEACAKENRKETKAVAAAFMKFIRDGFNGEPKETDELKEYFSSQGSFLIDTKGNVLKEQAALEGMKDLRNIWDKLAVDENAIYSDAIGDTAWVVCNGLAGSTISEQEGAEALMSGIRRITEKDAASKDKLFAVQKLVADYFLQFSKGEYFLWPIRIMAVLIRENEQWKLHGMSLSYPFYYILEGKYDSEDIR